MNNRIEILEKITYEYGLIKSNKELIPEHLPFKIQLTGAKDQGGWSYKFKETGFMDIESNTDAATYIIDRKNNTIKINSDKYDYYGIRLIDGYGYTISKTGLAQYSYDVQITRPIYNPVTQKYELN